MKRIPLTKGKEALVDNQDYDWLMARGSWCVRKAGKTYYARNSHQEEMHVLIASRLLGIRPSRIDHRDGNGLNNRRK
ncbi:MAG: hypothetical protein ACYDH4_12025, partial [Candidatus Cryosericum sp.]